MDLAVSAPAWGWPAWGKEVEGIDPQYNYCGSIFIFFGATSAQFARKLNAGLRGADVTITGAANMTGLGQTLTQGDLDGDAFPDLIVGSSNAPVPGLASKANANGGMVHAFLSSKQRLANSTLTLAQADAFVQGPDPTVAPFSRFGSSLAVASGDASVLARSVLLVGAPGHRTNSTTSVASSAVGRIFAFEWVSKMPANESLRLLFTITGQEGSARFGQTLSIGKPVADGARAYVAAGLPSANAERQRAGRVEIFSLDSLLTSQSVMMKPSRESSSSVPDFDIDNLPAGCSRATLAGSYFGGRFGQTILWSDVDNDGLDDLLVKFLENMKYSELLEHFV
jgi:hypothetical protein